MSPSSNGFIGEFDALCLSYGMVLPETSLRKIVKSIERAAEKFEYAEKQRCIVDDYERGILGKVIAERYGVSVPYICHLVKRSGIPLRRAYKPRNKS